MPKKWTEIKTETVDKERFHKVGRRRNVGNHQKGQETFARKRLGGWRTHM